MTNCQHTNIIERIETNEIYQFYYSIKVDHPSTCNMLNTIYIYILVAIPIVTAQSAVFVLEIRISI